MPRNSTKTASTSRSSSKRPAPGSPTRQSKRARATARKSYVEADTDGEDAGTGDRVSDYEEPSDNDVATDSDPEEVISEEEEEVSSKKGTSNRGSTKQKTLPIHKKHQANDQDMWKPGAKLVPGIQVIVKKPKAREAGEIPYTDDTIHPNTMLFLRDLAANNERQWMKLHDPDYRVALQDFHKFVERLSEKVVEVDETIPELPVKDIIFRIYRDVRFSKSQTPYKTCFSAAWSRTGRKGPYAAYYVQIQPDGGSFVGGGFWQPDAASLSKLRHDIDRKPHKIKNVLTNTGIRKSFLGGVDEYEEKAVKAFVGVPANQATALKRNPKGYDPSHQDIELLRLRSFTLGRKLSDDEVLGHQGLDRLAELVECMVPWITYLNSVVMPDEEESASSSSEEADDGEDDDDDDTDEQTG